MPEAETSPPRGPPPTPVRLRLRPRGPPRPEIRPRARHRPHEDPVREDLRTTISKLRHELPRRAARARGRGWEVDRVGATCRPTRSLRGRPGDSSHARAYECALGGEGGWGRGRRGRRPSGGACPWRRGAAARSIFDSVGRGRAGRREGAPGCASSGVPLGFRRPVGLGGEARGRKRGCVGCVLACLGEVTILCALVHHGIDYLNFGGQWTL